MVPDRASLIPFLAACQQTRKFWIFSARRYQNLRGAHKIFFLFNLNFFFLTKTCEAPRRSHTRGSNAHIDGWKTHLGGEERRHHGEAHVGRELDEREREQAHLLLARRGPQRRADGAAPWRAAERADFARQRLVPREVRRDVGEAVEERRRGVVGGGEVEGEGGVPRDAVVIVRGGGRRHGDARPRAWPNARGRRARPSSRRGTNCRPDGARTVDLTGRELPSSQGVNCWPDGARTVDLAGRELLTWRGVNCRAHRAWTVDLTGCELPSSRGVNCWPDGVWPVELTGRELLTWRGVNCRAHGAYTVDLKGRELRGQDKTVTVSHQ